MFEQGALVTYGIHGLCKITKVENMRVERKEIEFYVLEPVKQPGSYYYVPTQNKTAVSKLRPILTKEQLDDLLTSLDITTDSWIADENARKQRYRELINSGDRAALISMVKLIYMQKELLLSQGKKLHLSDDNFLRDAKTVLNSEFSVVLGIEQENVGEYIKNIIR